MNNFLGIQTNYKNSEFVILPVPYENKLSWRGGASKGPKAIIKASEELEFFSIPLKERICDKVKIHTSEELKVKNKSYEKMIKEVEENTSKTLKDGKKFALLGGEHSVSIGAINAISKINSAFSILHIDAHADLREEYLGSRYNHACVMKRALEKTKNIVSVGVRSYSKEEHELIKKEKLKVFGIEFENKEILKKIGKKVYITIDLDGFDPSEVPAVGTPQPGGLHWNKVLDLLELIGKEREIIGFDVVELAPLKNEKRSDFLAAKLVYNIINY